MEKSTDKVYFVTMQSPSLKHYVKLVKLFLLFLQKAFHGVDHHHSKTAVSLRQQGLVIYRDRKFSVPNECSLKWLAFFEV